MIDISIIEQLKEDVGPSLAMELLSIFIVESQKTVTMLVSSPNNDDIEINAHSLKSSCLSYGATTLGATCKRIEQKAKANEFDDELMHLLETAHTQSTVTFAKLQALVNSHTA